MPIDTNLLPIDAVKNLYGVDTRFEFCIDAISQMRGNKVLDFGCGTGDYLTVPLARYFPMVEFTAFDSDPNTILLASEKSKLPNLTFTSNPTEAFVDNHYSLVIASEVLEHLERPSEALSFLRRTLNSEGKIVLTLPNGFGPFEILNLVRGLYVFFGICHAVHLLRRLKWRIQRRPISANAEEIKDTAALSPHVNFFTFSQFKNLVTSSGFSIERFANRTFISGFGFDHLLCRKFFIQFNKKATRVVPAAIASSWMVLASPTPAFIHSAENSKTLYGSRK